MSLSEKNRLYQKFIDGSITVDEMHVLNQYALDDDFLFDAIEGVSSSYDSDFSRSMLQLEKQLNVSRKNRSRPLWIWLSAAASIAVLIIAISVWSPLQEPIMADVLSVEMEPEVEEEKVAEESVLVSVEPTVLESESTFPEPTSDVTQAEILRRQEGKLRSSISDEESNDAEIEPTLPTTPQAEEAILAQNESREALLQDIMEEKVEKTKLDDRKDEGIALNEVDMVGAAKPEVAKEESEVSNVPVLSRKAKKREKAPRGNAFATSPSEISSSTMVAVEIDNDPISALALQQYILKSYPISETVGTMKLQLTVLDGIRTSPVKILKSLNSEFDEKMRSYVESFEEWQGSGKKEINLRFTKGE